MTWCSFEVVGFKRFSLAKLRRTQTSLSMGNTSRSEQTGRFCVIFFNGKKRNYDLIKTALTDRRFSGNGVARGTVRELHPLPSKRPR